MNTILKEPPSNHLALTRRVKRAIRNTWILTVLSLLLPVLTHAATNEILYQTSFEAPGFTPGLAIRGQDNWETLRDGTAISISTNHARTGMQCMRMVGARLDQTGFNLAQAYCFSRALETRRSNPPPIVEISAYVRLDGPQTGTNGAPADDLMSANLNAIGLGESQPERLGAFIVSSAGRIFTVGSRPEDAYRFSAPMSFGAYHKLALRVDFLARTVRYFADDVELGMVDFGPWIQAENLVSGYLEMNGPILPLTTPYAYNRSNYTAYFDDYSLASIPLTAANVSIGFTQDLFFTQEQEPYARALLRRTGFLSNDVAVTVTTIDDSAKAGEDYEALSTVIVFAAGERARVVDIPLASDDYWAEPDKALRLVIADLPAGAASARRETRLLILDDERPGSVELLGSSTLGLSPLGPIDNLSVAGVFQPDGGLLVTANQLAFDGSSPDPVSARRRVVRLNADGAVDPSFQIFIATNRFGQLYTFLMPNGKIVLAEAAPNNDTLVILRRLNPDGTADPSLTSTIRCLVDNFGVVGLSNGKMLLLGTSRSQSGGAGVANQVNGRNVGDLVRLNADGSLDSSFTAPAELTFPVYAYYPMIPLPVVILPDGKLLIGAEGPRLVYLLNENGSLVPGFVAGHATIHPDIAPEPPAAFRPLRQADGKILVGGFFETFNGITVNGFMRLNSDGTRDPDFRVTGDEWGLGPFDLTLMSNGQERQRPNGGKDRKRTLLGAES